MNKKNKVLVFGAAGFIGTYLVNRLILENYEVTVSDINDIGKKYYLKNKINYYTIDITDINEFDKLKNSKFDFVIHLAALQPATFNKKTNTIKDYININVNGTLNILEFCRENNIKKIIYASSHRNTSGYWKNNLPIKESDGRCQEYNGEYAMFSISESSAQDCVTFYGENFDIDTILFRLPPVYGFGPHLDIFKNGELMKTGFQTLIDNAKKCKPIEIWGDLNVGRDIIYVKDVVSAFCKVLKTDNIKGLYNISSGYKLTLKEEVETIAKVFWRNLENPIFVKLPNRPHTIDSFVYDNTKAMRDFGWQPIYSFEKMLYDYEEEVIKNRFGFLIEKRKEMFN